MDIDPRDILIEEYRPATPVSVGTPVEVRITHRPTGIVAVADAISGIQARSMALAHLNDALVRKPLTDEIERLKGLLRERGYFGRDA